MTLLTCPMPSPATSCHLLLGDCASPSLPASLLVSIPTPRYLCFHAPTHTVLELPTVTHVVLVKAQVRDFPRCLILAKDIPSHVPCFSMPASMNICVWHLASAPWYLLKTSVSTTNASQIRADPLSCSSQPRRRS